MRRVLDGSGDGSQWAYVEIHVTKKMESQLKQVGSRGLFCATHRETGYEVCVMTADDEKDDGLMVMEDEARMYAYLKG